MLSRNKLSFTTRVAAFLGLALGLHAVTAPRLPAAPETRADTLAEADKLYEEKSYAGALDGYQRLLQGGKVPGDRKDDVQYRVAVSMGKSQKWDQALTYTLDFVKQHRGTVWEPRGLYWFGRLYLGVPHQGWKVGSKVTRGGNLPQTEAAEKPEQVWLQEQDSQNARDALEAARVLYPKFRAERKTELEEIQLNFDLNRVLQSQPDFWMWASAQKWSPPGDAEWKVDVSKPYSPEWAPPKKHVYLLEQIEALGKAKEGAKSHSAALSLLAQYMWLQQYQANMQNFAVKWENGKSLRIPYPYQDRKPDQPLRELLANYPEDPIRDQAQFTLGSYLESLQQFPAAVAEYRKLAEGKPESKWAEDARMHLDEITRRQLGVSPPPPTAPGKTPQVQVSGRNIKSVHFELYRVKLDNVLARADVLNDPQITFNNFTQNFGKIEGAQRHYGPLVSKWDWNTPDTGKHEWLNAPVNVPTKETGAYVLEASVQGIKTATVVLVTDLVTVQKLSRDEGLFYVTDAASGTPVANAEVVAKQWWHEGNTTRSSWKRGRTNAQGLFILPLDRGPGRNGFQIAALANRENRYALTDSIASWWGGDNVGHYKVHTTTDRAAYRPAQTVHYREIVQRRQGGEYRPAAGQSVAVTVRDARGQTVHQASTAANEFGSVSGSFVLPADAPLGVYSIQTTLPALANMPIYDGGNRFRVEEYKKPEFEVEVKPSADRVRLGQPASAMINVSYYFGGGVPNARVSYRIHRNYYRQWYHFPRPFEFLYQWYGQGDYNTGYRNGPVVKQGETRTDAKGFAEISFPTQVEGESDFRYFIEADVQDASRRTITGSGSVMATRRDVAAFLDFARGYATKGDTLDVEIMTVNPSDQPVSVEGTAKVYRYPDTPDAKETQVHAEPLKTDAKGRAYLHWKAETSGRFRIAFETRDTTGVPVTGSTDAWVNGPELEKGRFVYRDVLMRTQNLYYEEGQTAKVLLVTPEPGCTVLLTREVDNEISERRVVKVPGRSLELTFPLTAKDVPNVYLNAILVRDHQMFAATQELFVPPVRQFAQVSVAADKARYQPGEKARFKLTAKDWQGKPLRTELSVGVTDASLAYIQKDFAPDLRVFYYGQRRSISIPSSGSTGLRYNGATEDSQARKTFQPHEWLQPEGMGMLPDWPGEEANYYFGRRGYAMGGYAPGMGGMGGFGGGGGGGRYRMAPAAAAPLSSGGPAGPGGFAVAEAAQRPERDQRFGSKADLQDAAKAKKPSSGEGGDGGETRTNFADTAFWTPSVVTNASGEATVEVTWPDNLTEWRAQTVGTTTTAQVGSGETSVTVRKDLLVRLQAPRFFVERDLVALSANVHNYTDAPRQVQVNLGLGEDYAEIVRDKGTVTLLAGKNSEEATFAGSDQLTVSVPAGGERRVDWFVRVVREGNLSIRMGARSGSLQDAAQLRFPVLVHGAERQVAQGGVMRGEGGSRELTISLPRARKAGSSELVIQLNPSLAATMLDSLPYLADYPYGCIEQTVSRFVPSVVVSKTLQDLGYSLADLRKRAALLEEKEKAGDAARPGGKTVENSPYTYPKGRPGTIRVKELARNTLRSHNPVWDEHELAGMIREGLARITRAQNGDGGWGWWPGNSSDPYMSAYVLYGLQLARDADVKVDAGMLDRGLNYLRARFLEDDNFHRMAFEARVLAMDARFREPIKALTAGRVYENRERLSPYSKALLTTALHLLGDKEKAQILLRNVETTALVDDANGTANWEGSPRGWWYWYHQKIETNAAILQAYVQVRPDAKLPPMMVKWLVNNRRGNIWDSTKATAMAVYALSDYTRAQKELAPEYTLTVDLGGKVKRSYTVTRENALFFDNQFIVPDELLETGEQKLTLTKNGNGALYYTAFTTYFSQEEPIKATGNELFVKRRYFKLVAGTAYGAPQSTARDVKRPNPFLTGQYELLTVGGEYVMQGDTQSGPRYQRVELKDGSLLTSGDLIEVELQIESKNDYEYLAFEDLKPAGCEAVEQRSGGRYGGGLYSNVEFRDQKVAFFLDHLPQGNRTLSYRLRAEIPGRFHVLPAHGYAMYAPDIRGLSEEMTLSVKDE